MPKVYGVSGLKSPTTASGPTGWCCTGATSSTASSSSTSPPRSDQQPGQPQRRAHYLPGSQQHLTACQESGAGEEDHEEVEALALGDLGNDQGGDGQVQQKEPNTSTGP